MTANSKVVPPSAPIVAGLDGDWDGAIEAGSIRLRCSFHITTTDAGTTATMDSIDQGAIGIPVSSISRNGDSVSLELNTISVAFKGYLATDDRTLFGRWTQGGRTILLTLTRHTPGVPGPVLRRPQTPAKPYPYREEAVTYENLVDNVRLSGTLTLPQGTKRFPAVVLIHGSGPNDRDETIFGHKIFLLLADHLTRCGIAVLRFDKRGVNESTGDYASATAVDFAGDVAAALSYLKTRAEIDSSKIGLVGHSEGGMIAPMIAARDSSVAFIVLMAGPGIRGDEILVVQNGLMAKARGASDADVEQNLAIIRPLYAAIGSAADATQAATRAREILLALAKPLGMSDDAIEADVKMLSSNWHRFFLTYDPAPTLRQVRCPVLAINGTKDLQVPANENLAAIRNALANNRDVEVKELPDLNHLFQTARTGAFHEYGEIEETISPPVLDLISGWILRRAK